MRSDIERWNDKYSSHVYSQQISPDPVLAQFRSTFNGKGRSLDIASGVCDNALFLAGLGYGSFAVDGSLSALRIGKRKASEHSLELKAYVADLDSYPLPVEYFDVIVVVKYLNRSLTGAIKRSLKAGGVLLFKTFNKNFLKEKPGFPEAYILNEGELKSWFDDWCCLQSNEGNTAGATQSFWIGTKPRDPSRD